MKIKTSAKKTRLATISSILVLALSLTSASVLGASPVSPRESVNDDHDSSFAAQTSSPTEDNPFLALTPSSIQDNALIAIDSPNNKYQQSTNTTVLRTRRVVATAYSSTPDQTDSTPFITANGTYVFDGLVAANFLPFHTKIKIPEMFGDKVFTVEDRMHPRFSDRIDVWFPNRELA